MKWFTNLKVKYKTTFSKSNLNEGQENLEKGKKLYLSNQIQAALSHLDQAINLGFDTDAYEIRGNCFQKLDYHYKAIDDYDKAIEINPLEFSYYYSRAISKKAILDINGQIEDLHNAIYYYKRNKNTENNLLKTFETDLLIAKTYIESLKQNINELQNTHYLQIKNLIRDSLLLIKKVKLKKTNVYE
jgi:tetratricopeptide (TPR) repeat protein